MFSNTVGRKIVMAVTGLGMALFIVMHLAGNASIFIGPDALNSYAAKLQSLGPLVWVFRLAMLGLLTLHVFFGINIAIENSAASPQKYAVAKKLKATFASETMIWTGLLILVFIVIHLAQYTLKATPDIVQGTDAQGRFDVYKMVLSSMKHALIGLFYLGTVVVVFLHTSHGVQSLFQTLGLTQTDKALSTFQGVGRFLSTVFLVGYGLIPIAILADFLTLTK
jgi:succinate dehydrogenase / fumarate reductase cytochrome b subunit